MTRLLFILVVFMGCWLTQGQMSNDKPISTPIPGISKAIEDSRIGGLVNLWIYSLDVDSTTPAGVIRSAPQKPGTVVTSDSFIFTNLVPQDAPNPLYSTKSEFYNNLRKKFLLGQMLPISVEGDDPALETPTGIEAKTYSGEDVVFKKDAQGKRTVNDIFVTDQLKLSDGTNVWILDGVLFDYNIAIDEAFTKLINDPTTQLFDPFGRPLGPSEHDIEFIEESRPPAPPLVRIISEAPAPPPRRANIPVFPPLPAGVAMDPSPIVRPPSPPTEPVASDPKSSSVTMQNGDAQPPSFPPKPAGVFDSPSSSHIETDENEQRPASKSRITPKGPPVPPNKVFTAVFPPLPAGVRRTRDLSYFRTTFP